MAAVHGPRGCAQLAFEKQRVVRLEQLGRPKPLLIPELSVCGANRFPSLHVQLY
jgi:hypothetical protein